MRCWWVDVLARGRWGLLVDSVVEAWGGGGGADWAGEVEDDGTDEGLVYDVDGWRGRRAALKDCPVGVDVFSLVPGCETGMSDEAAEMLGIDLGVDEN